MRARIYGTNLRKISACFALLCILASICSVPSIAIHDEQSHRHSDETAPASLFDQAERHLEKFECDQAILIGSKCISASAKIVNPAKRKLYLARTFLLIGQGFKYDENSIAAAQAFRIALAFDPSNDEIRACLFDSMERINRREEAGPQLKMLLDSKSKSAFVLATLALHYSRIRNETTAEKFLAQATLISPRNARVELFKARTLMRRGFPADASREFLLAAKYESSPYLSLLYTAFSQSLSNLGSAILAAKKAGAINAADPSWQVFLGDQSAKNGDPDAAFRCYREAVNCKRLSTRAYKQLANYLSKQDREVEALRCIDRALDLRPYAADLYTTKGSILSRNGEGDKAADLWKQAIRLDPYETGAILNLAKYFEKRHQADKSIELLTKAVQDMPDDISMLFELMQLYAQGPDKTKLITTAKNLIALTAGSVDKRNLLIKNEVAIAHSYVGTELFFQGDMRNALQEAELQNRYKFIPDMPALLDLLHLRPGRLPHSKMAAEQKFNDQLLLADMLYETHHMSECIQAYEKAEALNPDDKEVHSYLLNAYSEAGDWIHSAREDMEVSGGLIKGLPGQFKRMIQK